MMDTTRRDFLCLAAAGAMALGLRAPAMARDPQRKISGKKGLCGGIHGAAGLTALRVGWFYNWGTRPPRQAPAGIEFVPQIFPHAKENIRKSCQQVVAAGYKVLLGYNEPDHSGQANLTVEEAVRDWPILEETKLKLISPAVTWAPNEWMKDFMRQAEKKKFRIDAVAIHWYAAPDADAFLKYVREAHRDYGKPIWITEFTPWEKSATKEKPARFTPRDVEKFLEAVVPELEKLDWVERYCLYSPHKPEPRFAPSCLFDESDGLTDLGHCYAAL